ncbi:MAG TPA: GNAT family N-acetyltransferase [Candidatus Dormibacteraeota bacterium]
MIAIERVEAGHPSLARLESSDCEPLVRFFYRLSPQTVYRRFLSPIARPEQLARMRLLELDGPERQAIAALVDGEIVGVARYAVDPRRPRTADLGIVVADAWQRQGLGTRLLAALADRALQAGVEQFGILTLADNQAAFRLLRRFAPTVPLSFDGGVYEAALPLRAA